MNIHDACEEAFKRGYERAKAEAEEEIKRKNAEIEKSKHYKSLYEELKAENIETIKAIAKNATTTRAEAIKEFAERVKAEQQYDLCGDDVVDVKDIDQIAKEMGVEL